MPFKSINILILLLLAATDLSAQSDTSFLDVHWNPVENRSQAAYFREINYNTIDSTIIVEDYFLETGRLQMIGYYKDLIKPGNQHGRFTYFYPSGHIKATYNYKNGEPDGKVKRFYENGNIETVETFKNGVEVDSILLYHQNGKIKEIKVVNPDHDVTKSEEFFKRYRVLHAWTERGEQQIKDGNGTYVEYQDNGNKLEEIPYTDGFPHGDWIRYKYGKKKKISSKMTFKNGVFIKGENYERGSKDIFSSIFREPRYPGGKAQLLEDIEKQTGYCDDKYMGEILVMINVYKDGQAEFEQVIGGHPTFCQIDEIKSFIQNMPDWLTAIEKGQYTESSYILEFKE